MQNLTTKGILKNKIKCQKTENRVRNQTIDNQTIKVNQPRKVKGRHSKIKIGNFCLIMQKFQNKKFLKTKELFNNSRKSFLAIKNSHN